MPVLLAAIIERGFFSSSSVQLALVVGALVAIVAGCVGVFTVIRGQSFAGEALGDIGATGGSSAYLAGIAPLWGFVAISVAAAGIMELIGIQRARGRDLATGIVLGAGFGLAALFLYLGTTSQSTTGATVTILFGSIFALDTATLPFVAVFGAVALATVLVLYRPLLLVSASPELAAARGLPVRVIGGLYLLAMALAVALSAVTIGAILSTALLVGPAATALHLTRRPGRAIVCAAVLGIGAMWLGIAARLRQLRLAAPPSRLAGQLLRRCAGAARLPRLTGRPHSPQGPLTDMFSGFMVNAWIVATIVATIGGAIGFFVVLRGSAFVAHAIPNGSFAGAAAASLVGINTIIGLGVFSVASALGIGLLSRRGRHDVATALTLVFMLGLGALFLSFSVEYAPEIYSLLFGEVLGISTNQLAPTIALAAVCLAALALLYRPLLVSSILPDSAHARGIAPYTIELGFLLLVALATTMTVPVVGTALIFSLMIGPAAAARAFTTRPITAIALSIAIALIITWAAIALSYQTNWPVGFYVGVISAMSYAAGRTWTYAHRRWTARPRVRSTPPALAGITQND